MPTYDYACRGCGHTFEAFHSITADPIRTCPECAADEVERLISGGGGLLFKGSGFYQTDYRSNSYKEAAKADSNGGGSGSGEKSSEGKSSDSSSATSTSTDTPTCGQGACPACSD